MGTLLSALWLGLQALLPGFFSTAAKGVVEIEKAKIDRAGDQAHLDEDLAAHKLIADGEGTSDQARMVIADEGHAFTRNVRPCLGLALVAVLALALYNITAAIWWHLPAAALDDIPDRIWDVLGLTAVSYLGHAGLMAWRNK